ncbi:MAG: toll/interleukin-1 receptor domain-containing protein [Paenibacillaceae bacterium]|nr:toll/interleukin-1 receptor domain-containing protein [Paenibacillaceae bacterium]
MKCYDNFYKGDKMKIFVSWSGELSKKIAQELKKWIPCIIQSVEVFYSAEDIEKGENWDSKISAELSECSYGIICLTSENTNAPWIHFEAGAIAKSLDSRVSALMLNIKTSDIQGPLKRYQATKFEKDDFYQLLDSINKATDCPLSKEVIETAFEAIWDKMYHSMNNIVTSYKPIKSGKEILKEDPIEEILQLLRKQNVLLSSPDQILSPGYLLSILNESRDLDKNRNNDNISNDLFMELVRFADVHLTMIIDNKMSPKELVILNDLMELLDFYSKRRGSIIRNRFMDLKEKYLEFSNRFRQKEYDLESAMAKQNIYKREIL